MPFSMSSARIAAFTALPPGPCAWRCSVLPIPSACRLPCGASSSGEACPLRSSFFRSSSCSSGVKGTGLQGGWDIPAHKVEVDFNLLCGVLAAFAGAFMDKDFLYKLVEHGVCQRVEILILINQGNKLLRRFPALLIAGNSLFQFRDFHIESVLLFGVLCVQWPHTGRPAACPGRCPHRFCKSAFQVPRPAFGRRPAVSASLEMSAVCWAACVSWTVRINSAPVIPEYSAMGP